MRKLNHENSWLCVHLGRPSSFTGVRIATPSPEEPFFLARVRLSELMNRCFNEIYIPTSGSLLPMWRTAESLICELHNYEDNVIATLGFGLHHSSQLCELDVQQTILTTRSWPVLMWSLSKVILTHWRSVFTYHHPCLSTIRHLQRKAEDPATSF